MSNHITIRKAGGTWSIRAGGAVIGESANALSLHEGGYEPVIYIPRTDVAMAFLEPSDKITTCPHKGQAQHYSIVTKSTVLKDAAWSYEDPNDDVAEIKDHLAFYPSDLVTVEEI